MTENEKNPRRLPGPVRLLLGALSGALAGCAALAVAEAVAGAVRPQAGPVVAVGGAAIDRTPAAVKDWAIRNFGADDKLVLQLGILAVLALFAVSLGIAGLWFRRTAAAGVLLFGAVGALAATGRPDSAGVTDALPSAAGAVAAAVLLYVLTGRLEPRTEPHAPPTVPPGGDWDRRGFVIAASTAAVASAGAGLLGRALAGAAWPGRGRLPAQRGAARARIPRPRRAEGRGTAAARPQPVRHAQRGLLPRRHRPRGAQGGRDDLEAADPRQGSQPSGHALIRRSPGP